MKLNYVEISRLEYFTLRHDLTIIAFLKKYWDFAFYELFLLKEFLCCFNTTFVNRFLQTLPLNTTDLISTLF